MGWVPRHSAPCWLHVSDAGQRGMACADLEGIPKHGVLVLGRQCCQSEDDEQAVRLQAWKGCATCRADTAEITHNIRPGSDL